MHFDRTCFSNVAGSLGGAAWGYAVQHKSLAMGCKLSVSAVDAIELQLLKGLQETESNTSIAKAPN